jgi:Acetyltransferase (GNAT) domain
MKPDYTVIEADLCNDRPDILAMWQRNFNGESAKRYAWLYEHPASAASAWMVKTMTGTVVGATGLLCRKIKIGGREAVAGQAVDMVVDERHRMAGPALMLQRALIRSFEKKGISLIYGFPNEGSEKVMMRAGYRVLGSFERWTKPLRSEYKLKSMWKGLLPVKTISLLIDIGMKALSRESYLKRDFRGTRIEPQTSFDRRFDALWEKTSKAFHIIGERTSSYLNWRFGNDLRQPYYIFCFSGGNGALLGYIVYQRRDNLIAVADFCATDLDRLQALLVKFIHWSRSENIASISITFLGSSEVTDCLKRAGFYKRPSRERVLVYLTGDTGGGPGMLNKDLWYLTDGDKDV